MFPHSFYFLRNDMLTYYVTDIAERLAARNVNDGWQVRFQPCNLTYAREQVHCRR